MAFTMNEHEQKLLFQHHLEEAKHGCYKSQYFVGSCYYHGHGVEDDDDKAFRWFQSAAAQGCAKALYMMGDCCSEDHESEVYWSDAMPRLIVAAEDEHDAESQYLLGDAYHYGCGGLDCGGQDSDKDEALRWYKKAAEQGHPIAQHVVGMFCKNRCHATSKSDEKMAFQWFRKSAESGCADGTIFDLQAVAALDAVETKMLKAKLEAANKQNATLQNKLRESEKAKDSVRQELKAAMAIPRGSSLDDENRDPNAMLSKKRKN